MSDPESPSPGSLPPELKGFEASLAALVPTALNFDRDRLMYEAGRASRPRSYSAWIGAIAGCAATLAFMFVPMSGPFRTSAPVANRFEDPSEVRTEIDPAAAARLAEPDSYLQLRRYTAEAELAAVAPLRDVDAAPAATDRNSLLRELLN